MNKCIYQVHESGGEWEDYYDRICGSFYEKQNAQKFMDTLIIKENRLRAKSEKCNACMNHDITVIKDMPCFIEYRDDDQWFDCSNCFTYWDEKDYKIVEVEMLDWEE